MPASLRLRATSACELLVSSFLLPSDVRYSLELMTAYSNAMGALYAAPTPAAALERLLPALAAAFAARVTYHTHPALPFAASSPSLGPLSPVAANPTSADRHRLFLQFPDPSGIIAIERNHDFAEGDVYLADLLQRHLLRAWSGAAICPVPLSDAPAPAHFLRLQSLGLTPRECEVLVWIAEGKRDAEIAAILGIASRTVSKHVENLLAKLGAETRLGAAQAAHACWSASGSLSSSAQNSPPS